MKANDLVFAGLMALAIMIGPASAQEKKWDTVRIGTDGAYNPWTFMDSTGTLIGLDTELANDFCARMKVKCEFVILEWEGIIPALNAGKIDAIMSGMHITAKRKEVMGFSRPYAVTRYTHAVIKGGPLADLPGKGQLINLSSKSESTDSIMQGMRTALDGSIMGLQGGTTSVEFVDTYFGDVVEVREYKTREQELLDLAAGRVDIINADLTNLKFAAEKPEMNLELAGPIFEGGPYGEGTGIGLRQADVELKRLFDDAITAAVADGTISKLSQKWLKADQSPDK